MTETKQHAKLSASGSSRWLLCPGSIKAESKFENTTSVYAEEGTMAHEVADLCLSGKVDADRLIGNNVLGKTVTKEMAEHVQSYLDYVRSFETEDSILHTEETVDFSNVVPDGFGTLDSAVFIPKQKKLHIFDLKYGQGVVVDAFENTQGQMYGIGYLNEYGFLEDIETIEIHIVQPRVNNYSSWEISVKDLKTFSKWVKERAELALSADAPRVPGEKQCQWCRAKNDCKALLKFTQNVLKCDFDNTDDPFAEEQTLTDEDRKVIIDNKKLITDFMNSIESEVYTRLLDGGDFKGYKLVEGRSNRVWNNEAETILAEKLGDEAYKKSLIGIGEAEKKLGKKEVDDLTDKPMGRPTMVPDTDKRKPFTTYDVANDFKD